MQNVHPTMAAFLAPFAPSYYTLHPDLDAARWEADQDAQSEREEVERAERLKDLEYSFMRALEAGKPLPTIAEMADWIADGSLKFAIEEFDGIDVMMSVFNGCLADVERAS